MADDLKWWLRFACVVACMLLPSCATVPPAGRDIGCRQESCLLPALMDLSMPNAQKYILVRRAMAAGFDVQAASPQFRGLYATLASFVGAYEEADRLYPMWAQHENPAAAGYTRAIPAADTIRALARSSRAVFVNEAHASARTRAAIYSLLRPLREEGYGYLALEALTTKPADSETSCADADLFDQDLAARGYPAGNSGVYTHEPIYGAIVREALRLGFRLVAYESADPAATTIAKREQGMAQNLACIFTQDKQAKMLVIAGFAHISEAPDGGVPGGMMAARFKGLTAIDPLSIDTTKLLYVGSEPFHFGKLASERFPSQGYVLSDAGGRLYGTDSYDLVLLTPSFAGRERNERSWLTLDGARNRVLISTVECARSWPCVVQAFLPGEKRGIPADSCVVEDEGGTCPLFLTQGEFRIEYSGMNGKPAQSKIFNVPP